MRGTHILMRGRMPSADWGSVEGGVRYVDQLAAEFRLLAHKLTHAGVARQVRVRSWGEVLHCGWC